MRFYMSTSHLAFPDNVAKSIYQQFNKWHKKKKKKKKTLHILIHGAMWGCGLTALVGCINGEIHDIKQRNVTIRREI